ncbi:flagellar biosynthesis protein FlhB [Tissierella pigra]|uniref:Flagellar biosynthetic protein FlhB n=1 Tax=Tissierella pigra TaxID=2607614 RepID=A0A6N7XUL5_9FIRM|nr:flagellar biosynthesis protein FlhB [Tissierella pigra]MBU5426547.1 flagellar biosynthesis protein FlhB [Tissierella pigra]MSU00008.1 flagellar biosynthesis protein FlhB [Tissierella pigra]
MILKLDLQLFSEKTEKPTPKKRRDAREEGQILQSKEINTVVILFSCFIGLKVFGGFMSEQLKKFMIDIFSEINNTDVFLNYNNLMINFLKILTVFIIVSAPILAVAFLSSLIINYFQVGFLFTNKTLKIKLNRLNPIEGFKKIFSKRALMELVKSVLKLWLVGYVTINYGKDQIARIVELSSMEPIESFINFSNLLYGFIIRILSVLFVLAIMDYIFQWRQHEKNLMMSKQEIKEEYKQTEGDPFIKGKIKERQRRMAMSRMMQDIPKADVIITNPTHYAIAIKYDKDKFLAPYILGKGVDLIAENIKKIAKENMIPIVENKPLARAIYDSIDIGDIITEDLYEAVAEVLAYVYSLKDEN